MRVAVTLHGPVIQWDIAHGVAYSQRYAERGKELDNWVGIVELARAKNLSEFEAKGIARIAWNLGVCYGRCLRAIWLLGSGSCNLRSRRSSTRASRRPVPGNMNGRVS